MKRCQFHLIHKGSARKMMNLNYQGSNNKTLNFEECDMGLNEDTKEENENTVSTIMIQIPFHFLTPQYDNSSNKIKLPQLEITDKSDNQENKGYSCKYCLKATKLTEIGLKRQIVCTSIFYL